jgi:hypothetical protein
MSGFLSITTLATSKCLYYFAHDVYLHVFSFSLLSAYDMGAPAKVLQAIYDSAAAPLNPLGFGLGKNEVVQIDENNWFDYLGDEKCAPSIGFLVLMLTCIWQLDIMPLSFHFSPPKSLPMAVQKLSRNIFSVTTGTKMVGLCCDE